MEAWIGIEPMYAILQTVFMVLKIAVLSLLCGIEQAHLLQKPWKNRGLQLRIVAPVCICLAVIVCSLGDTDCFMADR